MCSSFKLRLLYIYKNSIWFRFREDCLSTGKYLLVWTVNDPAHMMEVSVSGIIFSCIDLTYRLFGGESMLL